MLCEFEQGKFSDGCDIVSNSYSLNILTQLCSTVIHIAGGAGDVLCWHIGCIALANPELDSCSHNSTHTSVDNLLIPIITQRLCELIRPHQHL